MKTIKDSHGVCGILDPEEIKPSSGVANDYFERLEAAVATIEKESPAAFAGELSKVKAKSKTGGAGKETTK